MDRNLCHSILCLIEFIPNNVESKFHGNENFSQHPKVAQIGISSIKITSTKN
jgi:hypothetical protein